MAHFIVDKDSKEWKSPKVFALKILRTMQSNLVDDFELHAYGRRNVRFAEEIALMLHRWMHVIDIETGFTDMPDKRNTDCYIIVFFK